MRLYPSAALFAAFALSAGFAQADTTLSLLADNGAANVAALQALADAYHAAHPDVTIEIEQRPGGADGDTSSRRVWPPARCPTSSPTTRARCSRR